MEKAFVLTMALLFAGLSVLLMLAGACGGGETAPRPVTLSPGVYQLPVDFAAVKAQARRVCRDKGAEYGGQNPGGDRPILVYTQIESIHGWTIATEKLTVRCNSPRP